MPTLTMPESSIIPVLYYADVPAGVEWLCRVFGFRERWRIAEHRAQLSYGNGTIAITDAVSLKEQRSSVMLRVTDAQAHFEHARSCDAVIVMPPTDFFYGERQYSALDKAGHTWTFSETIHPMSPEDWGGRSADAGQ